MSPQLQDEIHSRGTGATVLGIKAKLLKQVPFSYPLIPEQKRIVAILDQAFADIEDARCKTEQNLKNARELFESYLQQVFSQHGDGWIETNLGAVAEFKNGLNFSQSSKGEKLKIVGVKDFKSNFMVPYEQLDTIQIDGNLSEAYELKENDIITVRSNGNKRLIGRCLLMGEVNSKTSYSGFTIRIRLKNNQINAEFLTYYLKSASTHELLINSGEGANISNLNQKILTALPVTYPSYEQQIKLLSNIKKIEGETDSLKKVYANKLASMDELKKSILQKAFSGELTDMNKEC
jgi:type I restriction enzyme S subunit